MTDTPRPALGEPLPAEDWRQQAQAACQKPYPSRDVLAHFLRLALAAPPLGSGGGEETWMLRDEPVRMVVRLSADKQRVEFYDAEMSRDEAVRVATNLLATLDAAPAGSGGETLADRVVQRVAELPDRSSPEDWPEAMLVTAAELSAIIASETGGASPELLIPKPVSSSLVVGPLSAEDVREAYFVAGKIVDPVREDLDALCGRMATALNAKLGVPQPSEKGE